jgi:hypothetical protein
VAALQAIATVLDAQRVMAIAFNPSPSRVPTRRFVLAADLKGNAHALLATALALAARRAALKPRRRPRRLLKQADNSCLRARFERRDY